MQTMRSCACFFHCGSSGGGDGERERAREHESQRARKQKTICTRDERCSRERGEAIDAKYSRTRAREREKRGEKEPKSNAWLWTRLTAAQTHHVGASQDRRQLQLERKIAGEISERIHLLTPELVGRGETIETPHVDKHLRRRRIRPLPGKHVRGERTGSLKGVGVGGGILRFALLRERQVVRRGRRAPEGIRRVVVLRGLEGVRVHVRRGAPLRGVRRDVAHL